MDPAHWLQLQRTVRFGDTDAAGVMHFHQLLHWCHEAYEESLERYGIPARAIFPIPDWADDRRASANPVERPTVALPIVHCSADYLAPLVCGDQLKIHLQPRLQEPGGFSIDYRFEPLDPLPAASPPVKDAGTVRPLARACTRHLAIDNQSRLRCSLPTPIRHWLEASEIGLGVRPL
jgi:1,4-dihydroxy-2-naphthoyl-CoA hydrolase